MLTHRADRHGGGEGLGGGGGGVESKVGWARRAHSMAALLTKRNVSVLVTDFKINILNIRTADSAGVSTLG